MFGSFMNMAGDQTRSEVPEIGMGATLLMWTDRKAGTIIEVSQNGKTVKWQRDRATRADSNGMSDAQSYTYERKLDGKIETFTLRKNGRWKRVGDPMNGSETLLIGTRDEYYDYSF
jgi:hypothetical protein